MKPATIKRVKVTYDSPDLHCKALHGVGWTVAHDCGERFPIRRDPDDAKRDAIVHTQTCDNKQHP